MPETTLSSPSVSRTWGVPFESLRRSQATLTRRRLYPLTIFYTLYGIVVLHIAFSTTHPWIAVTFFFVGCVVWILTEYLFRRFVQNGRFPADEGIIRRSLQERMNPLHWEHQLRAFDPNQISGGLKDALPLFFLAGPISVFFPFYTTPVLLAGIVESYVVEEWLHYALQFSKSRVPFIRRMKKYHLYHCRLKDVDRAYTITARFRDGVFPTQFPETVRRPLGED